MQPRPQGTHFTPALPLAHTTHTRELLCWTQHTHTQPSLPLTLTGTSYQLCSTQHTNTTLAYPLAHT